MAAGLPREEDEPRPGIVLAVYSWDLVLAILALFGILAPFAGGIATQSGPRNLPLAAQIIAALSSAAFATLLIIVASLLTRRRRWVRLVQMATMAAAVVLAGGSLLVDWVIGAEMPLTALLVTLLFMLIDVLVLVLMTERRVTGWYREPGSAPQYVIATLGLWTLLGCAQIVIAIVLR